MEDAPTNAPDSASERRAALANFVAEFALFMGGLTFVFMLGGFVLDTFFNFGEPLEEPPTAQSLSEQFAQDPTRLGSWLAAGLAVVLGLVGALLCTRARVPRGKALLAFGLGALWLVIAVVREQLGVAP